MLGTDEIRCIHLPDYRNDNAFLSAGNNANLYPDAPMGFI